MSKHTVNDCNPVAVVEPSRKRQRRNAFSWDHNSDEAEEVRAAVVMIQMEKFQIEKSEAIDESEDELSIASDSSSSVNIESSDIEATVDIVGDSKHVITVEANANPHHLPIGSDVIVSIKNDSITAEDIIIENLSEVENQIQEP